MANPFQDSFNDLITSRKVGDWVLIFAATVVIYFSINVGLPWVASWFGLEVRSEYASIAELREIQLTYATNDKLEEMRALVDRNVTSIVLLSDQIRAQTAQSALEREERLYDSIYDTTVRYCKAPSGTEQKIEFGRTLQKRKRDYTNLSGEQYPNVECSDVM